VRVDTNRYVIRSGNVEVCGRHYREEAKVHRRLLIVAACMMFVAAVIAPGAGADPTNAKNATQLYATCDGQRVDVVVIGNGEFTPAHDLASTSVFIPTAFATTFTFTPAGGGEPFSETDTSAKSAPLANTVTCDIPLQTLFSGPEGTSTIQGTVTGFFTPR
jgi:hypothetical protein